MHPGRQAVVWELWDPGGGVGSQAGACAGSRAPPSPPPQRRMELQVAGTGRSRAYNLKSRQNVNPGGGRKETQAEKVAEQEIQVKCGRGREAQGERAGERW